MTRYVTTLLLLTLGAAASPLGAQAAQVRVVDAGTGRPIEAAEVRPLGADSLLVRAIGYRVARVGRDVTSVSLTPLAIALEQVVITAAKREQKLADAVVTTEVLTSDAIARTGATDLASALVAATGIEFTTGTPAGAGVMLQGMSSARVLILLDGQPLPGRIGGDFDLSRIPTAGVERVEVVKGPQSSLYGTDAMGGVVNIITRAPRLGAPAVSANAMVGSRNRMDASAAADASFGAVAVRGEAGRRSIETTPGRAEERGALSERLDAMAKVKWTASPATTVDATVAALDERQRWLSGSLYNFGDNLQLTARATATRATGDGSRASITLFGSSYDHLARASAVPQPIRGDSGQRQVQRLAQGELAYTRVLAGQVVDAGMLVRHDDTESVRIPGGRRALLTLEPSLQVESPIGADMTLVTGTRVSHSERWGTHFTPRVAMRWRPARPLTLRASAGAGFRAPDFRELYMRFQNESAGYAVYGSEDLRPETSHNVSLGAEWATESGYLRGQLFHNQFDGFIEAALISAPGQPLLFEYRNVEHGYTRGAEVEGAAVMGALRLDAGYGLLSTRDDLTGQPLLGRPTHSARATAAHPLALGARASVSALYTGRTPMQRDSMGTSFREAYPRLDLRLARPLTRDAELTFHVENALDRRPTAWAGYTGRQFTVGVQWAQTF